MKDKPVRIRRISQLDEIGSCHTLFVSSSEDVRLAGILETLNRIERFGALLHPVRDR